MKAKIVSTNSTATLNDSLLRLEQVMQITSLCPSRVFLLAKQGKLPASIIIGVRGARWNEREVHQWVADPIALATGLVTFGLAHLAMTAAHRRWPKSMASLLTTEITPVIEVIQHKGCPSTRGTLRNAM